MGSGARRHVQLQQLSVNFSATHHFNLWNVRSLTFRLRVGALRQANRQWCSTLRRGHVW